MAVAVAAATVADLQLTAAAMVVGMVAVAVAVAATATRAALVARPHGGSRLYLEHQPQYYQTHIHQQKKIGILRDRFRQSYSISMGWHGRLRTQRDDFYDEIIQQFY
jgi:hypothetical protein